jgi:TatA/E family protein of Tat protein translocase
VANIGPTELLIFLAILLLIFGAAKLPKLARSMGQAGKEFKAGLKEGYQAEDVEGPCPFCGIEIGADAKFCPGCGKPASEVIAEKEKKKTA